MAVRSAGAAVAFALLGGCGESTDAPAVDRPSAPMTIRNEYHDGMLRLGDLQRGAALRAAIRSAGESCDRVEASAFQQDYTNLKMWTARCQSTEYAVFLAATGDVQVRKCADASALRLPACRASTAATKS